ncbi:uncharacterized protein LTR77_010387 [Saxophila tyrrhenica]|uniref:Glycosyl hydrolase n=1 Tax=Saxophila tyrrhenica TaxID=1690608 RepID=A0AAV9NYX6_9PEZI|nr:hypothetical protein LTR77_010387 [Saxophila tyrrhenica]
MLANISRMKTTALLAACCFTTGQAASKAEYSSHALDATNVLNDIWYDPSTGLWQDLWWQSASMIASLANFASLDRGNYFPMVNDIFETTLANAMSAGIAGSYDTFFNDYYDDEGWWAMGWIRVYDLTGDAKYLDTARKIFTDMQTGEDATCGGHWWSKKKDANVAIANEQYMAVAASLANRIPAQKSMYADIATGSYDWFMGSGLINGDNTVTDHLNLATCEPEGNVWSYNQGVIIGACLELNRLTSDGKYLDTASRIAHGAIDHLTGPKGILTDFASEAPMDITSAQFKGVFARNLRQLHSVAPDAAYVSFLQNNADTLWIQARQSDGQIGPEWAGPYIDATAPSQSSALDCLVAAAAVS